MCEQTAITRSIEEITISVQMNMQDMVSRALALGMDLIEAKEVLGHGGFLPWLKKIGITSSTAHNYMRVAEAINESGWAKGLTYSKVLALLNAPEKDREDLSRLASEISAGQLKKLIEERNKAAEAANTESARADQAEADAKRYYDEIGTLNKKIAELEAQKAKAYNEGHKVGQKVAWDDIDVKGMAREINELRETRDDLKAKLLEAENHRVEVEKVVEVAPADYEILKANQKDLLAAAEDAEQRAAAAEAERDALLNGTAKAEKPMIIILNEAMNGFFSQCELMPFNPEAWRHDKRSVSHCVQELEAWCKRMREAVESSTMVIDGAGSGVHIE